jgi:hypothetical protein
MSAMPRSAMYFLSGRVQEGSIIPYATFPVRADRAELGRFRRRMEEEMGHAHR